MMHILQKLQLSLHSLVTQYYREGYLQQQTQTAARYFVNMMNIAHKMSFRLAVQSCLLNSFLYEIKICQLHSCTLRFDDLVNFLQSFIQAQCYSSLLSLSMNLVLSKVLSIQNLGTYHFVYAFPQVQLKGSIILF